MTLPYDWIEECFYIFGIAESIKKLLSESMKSWRTELTSGSNVLGEVQLNLLKKNPSLGLRERLSYFSQRQKQYLRVY